MARNPHRAKGRLTAKGMEIRNKGKLNSVQKAVRDMKKAAKKKKSK